MERVHKQPKIEIGPQPSDNYDYRAFMIHLGVFCLTMCVLLALNLTDHHTWWVQWPFIGWGVGLFLHGLAVDHNQRRDGARKRLFPGSSPTR